MGRNSGKYGRKTAVIEDIVLNTLSDEELLREIHECKIEYKEAEIIILMDSPGLKKRILTIIQSHDIIAKRQKRDWQDESGN